MDRRRSFRLTLDGGMALIFLLLMAARYTGGVVHEWLGVLILVPVLMHVHVNKGWWKTVPRVVLIRPFRTGVNLLTAFFLVGAMLSGIPISENVFAFAGGEAGLHGRSVHMFFAHWALLFAAFHLGAYGKRLMVLLQIPVSRLPRRAVSFSGLAAVMVAGYGAWAFVVRDLALPLSMRTSFTVWNADDSAVRLVADYLAVFCLATTAAYVLSALAGRGCSFSPGERNMERGTSTGNARAGVLVESGKKLP